MGRVLTAVAVAAGSLACPFVGTARADWDPDNGVWGKTTPADVRVMTWNVEDGICSSNTKVEDDNNWTALARIVAAMKPDVLIIQEAGDNTGNGTGGGVDSVGELEDTIDEFVHGDGGISVTAWVQKYAPAFDLPFVFVSGETDGFNRNVVLSRFEFHDLNGDGTGTLSDIYTVIADAYAPGGDGKIRGFQFVEMELDDAIYRGDLVAGNAHLKSGGGLDDKAQRLTASQNVAYFIDYWFNGAGTGTPDPNGKIQDSPPATSILSDFTPVIFGGDWNEDEATNGRKGPADWLTRAQFTGGTDGTDRDRTDSTYDNATHVFTGSRNTLGSRKLDYIAWQDSIASVRRAFVFNTSGTPEESLPAEVVDGYIGDPSLASFVAADHRPVIVDFILPLFGDFDGDGIVGIDDYTDFVDCYTGPGPQGLDPYCQAGDFDEDDDIDCADWIGFENAWSADGSPPGFSQCGGTEVGACCTVGECSYPSTPDDCSGGGGFFQGDGITCEAVQCVAPGAIVITEIMYNPDSDESLPNDVEWVEILNLSDETILLDGWYLEDEDGATASFSGGATLDPGQTAVLIPDDQSAADFESAWGAGINVYTLAGWGSSGLSGLDNDPSAINEVLALLDDDGQVIDEVNFDDESGWPSDDPDGPSIYLLPGFQDAVSDDSGANWARSVDGVAGAYLNVATSEFDGLDVGSPGFVPDCVTVTDCDDGVDCTDDSCDLGSCVNAPNAAFCSNSLFCDGEEVCNPVTGCQPGSDPCAGAAACNELDDECIPCFTGPDCNDGIFCTIDECIDNVCVRTPDHSVCSDGQFCNGAEVCDPQFACLPGTPPCVGIPCDEVNDFCGECLDATECVDGDVCTQDKCVAGLCSFDLRVYGDVNADGVVSLFDVFCVLDGIAEEQEPPCTPSNLDIEPCGGNDVVSLLDLFAILDAIGGDDPCCGE
jgi:hypothetical protein